jgi:sugar/nucleoside kinase (ribokinase family)
LEKILSHFFKRTANLRQSLFSNNTFGQKYLIISKMKLVEVGTVAFDAIETPFGKTDKIIGGAATYIGLAASFFIEKSGLISVIGEDFPSEYIDSLKKKGIDTTGLEVIPGGKSFFWSGKYHDNMNSRDTLITELNVLEHFDPKVPEVYQGCEFLMLGNLSPQVQGKVLDQLTTRPKLVALDTMNFWMDIAMEDLKAVIKRIDLLIINDEEARQLSGEYSLNQAAQKIMELGPKNLIIKKGEHGALVYHEDGVFSAPAVVLDTVKDPTGAGDTFAGGIMGYLASKGDVNFSTLKQAVLAGSALASFTCEAFGTDRLFEITREDIDIRISEIKELIKI